MDVTKTPRKLWEHADPKSTAMWKFMQETNRRYGLNLKNFQDLYTWSCAHRKDFYAQVWDTYTFIHEGSPTEIVDESIPISKLPRWFPGVKMNWAENFLYSHKPGASPSERGTLNKEDDKIAITAVREGNTEVKHVTWRELRERAAQMASALHARGVRKGDRVVAVAAHAVDTLAVFLGATWLGALFSSSSTDMGVGGLLQRTVQINPKFVFFDDGALYNGKVIDLREKMAGVVEGLKECDAFEGLIAIQRFDKPYDTSSIPKTTRLEDFLQSASPTPPPFARLGFQDPMIVYYSSGTTGAPKAIVHAVGPLLVTLIREGLLHREISPSDIGLQYTTTGWIMYLSSLGIMVVGGRCVMYDGSPFLPNLTVLLKITEEQNVTNLGISPRWIGEMMKNGIVPKDVANLSSLKRVGSTGMVLTDQAFEWFYDVGFPKQVHLCNFSGGTDIAGTFASENPLTPVYVGGCQGGSLGCPIAIYDHDAAEGVKGTVLPEGEAGDIVATGAFPNIPVFLWNDTAPAPGAKYRAAYFDRFQDVWCQGDFAAIHPITKGIYFLGRSDGVLNPSGIRFGSSDIYAVVERLFAREVAESICVGQRRRQDLDERVFLFLLMKPGVTLDGQLVKKMKDTIAREMTKRHVPKYIFQVPEIPTTVNGKKVELPVKKIISGNRIKPSGTLLNPESLDFFYQFQEVEKLEEPKAKL